MKILEKYLLFTILKKSLAVLIALVLLMSLFKFIDEFENIGHKNYSYTVAIQYIVLLLPSFFNSFTILAFMIGVIFAIGKFNSDRELQIFITGSISIKRIIFQCLKYPFYFSSILLLVFELISPKTFYLAEKLKNQALGKQINVTSDSSWIKKENKVIFIKKLDKHNHEKINQVLVFHLDENNNLMNILRGEDFKYETNKILIHKAQKINLNKNEDLNYPRLEYFEDWYKLDLDNQELISAQRDIRTMTFFELVKAVIYSYQNEINSSQFSSELISRVIRPFTLVGMILLSVPFVFSMQRSISLGNRIFLAVSIGVLTHLLTKVMGILAIKINSLTFIGPLLPSLILILSGIYFLRLKHK